MIIPHISNLFLFYALSSVNAEVVKSFKVEGNKRISDETIIIFSEIKLNDEITKSKLDNAIKKLYKTSMKSGLK